MFSKFTMILFAPALLAMPLAAGHAQTDKDHGTLGECYDYVIAQYNEHGDEDGLNFGLDDCDDAYAEAMVGTSPAQIKALKDSKRLEAIGTRRQKGRLE